MAENTTPDTLKSESAIKADETKGQEVKAPTPEELAKAFSELPNEFQQAIRDLNKDIDTHNSKVDSVKASEAKDPKLIKAEIYEQNPNNNKKLKALYDQEMKLQAQIEKLRAEAYKVIDDDGLMPQELTEEQIEKLKGEITESTKNLREGVSALLKFEEMMPIFAGKFSPHITEIKTRRGAAKTSSSAGTTGEVMRPRFKKIEVNGVTEDTQGNKVYVLKDGEPKYTFTSVSAYLKKQHKGIKWTAKDLIHAYLGGKASQDEVPEIHEFVMPHTYKDANGNEHTVNYTVKAYR
jgi:hypothetical protein